MMHATTSVTRNTHLLFVTCCTIPLLWFVQPTAAATGDAPQPPDHVEVSQNVGAASDATPTEAPPASEPVQEPGTTDTPPTTAAPAQDGDVLQATVTGVEGIVQARTAEDQPWQAVKLGMVLPVGAEFRTGPRSAVRFTIPPAQVITLDRLGTIKVLDAIQTPDRVTTNLGMKYGRTRYNVEAAGLEYETTISTPSATLAVRGTDTGVFDQAPFNSYAWSIQGRVSSTFKGLKRAKRTMGGKGLAEATAEQSPAGFQRTLASSDAVMGGFDGDSPNEDELEQRHLNRAGDHIRKFGAPDNPLFARQEMLDEEFREIIEDNNDFPDQFPDDDEWDNFSPPDNN